MEACSRGWDEANFVQGSWHPEPKLLALTLHQVSRRSFHGRMDSHESHVPWHNICSFPISESGSQWWCWHQVDNDRCIHTATLHWPKPTQTWLRLKSYVANFRGDVQAGIEASRVANQQRESASGCLVGWRGRGRTDEGSMQKLCRELKAGWGVPK